MTLLTVPNISEGRRPDLVRTVAGDSTTLLDVHIDFDHNRSVLTYGGDSDALSDACVALITRAVEMLDITTHTGVHPRYGVVDVLPIVPYDASVQDANALAQRIASAAPVPVYNYTDDLPELRRRLRSPHEAHPTAGVLCIGVRGPLIAFNVNLRSTIAEARAIVTELRRLPGVRALAFELPARALVQVSMNLTEPSITGPRAAFDRVAELATDIADAEIVGLIPAANKTELEGLPLRAPARSVEEALRG